MGCTCSQQCLSGRSVCVACLHRVRDLLYVVTNILDRRPVQSIRRHGRGGRSFALDRPRGDIGHLSWW
jgi:hypothetical protein